MWLSNKIRKVFALLQRKVVKGRPVADSSRDNITLAESQGGYSYDLCQFAEQELCDCDGKKIPLAFLYWLGQCCLSSYHDTYEKGGDLSRGLLVVAETTKSKDEVEQIAFAANGSWSEEADTAVRMLLVESASVKAFCNAESVTRESPDIIRGLLPAKNNIRYLLIKDNLILLDYVTPVSRLSIECDYGGIGIYISPNLSQNNIENALANTNKIYYLLHSEMTGDLPEGAAIRIQHGRNMHWSRAADEPYNKGIYVCVVHSQDLDKEMPAAKVFTSASGKLTHAISLNTAIAQYSQCGLKTSGFIELVPKSRKDELLSIMHSTAKEYVHREERVNPLESVLLVVFNKDSIADLESQIDAVFRFSSPEELFKDPVVPEELIEDLEKWIGESPELSDWADNITSEHPLVFLACTDAAIAAFRPSSAYSGDVLFRYVSLNCSVAKEDNLEDLASRAGYVSLLRSHDSWVDTEAFAGELDRVSTLLGLDQ